MKINDSSILSIEKDFLQYEESLELKQLGFDEPCFKYVYVGDTGINVDHYLEVEPSKAKNYNGDLCVSQPTFSQSFRWFREKHKLHSSIDFQKLKEGDDDEDIALYEWKINEQWQLGKDWYDFKYGFKHHSLGFNHVTYEEAELSCLRKLIEIVKQKY